MNKLASWTRMREDRRSSSTAVLQTGAFSADETDDNKDSSNFAMRSCFFMLGFVS